MKDLLQTLHNAPVPSSHTYKQIAESLMNDYKLQVRDQFYRIIECEFYYNCKDHEDPYVHGHKRQRESRGEWYFHGSGLDITLSNVEAYGGILIRGLARVRIGSPVPCREDAIIGPLNVCTEIFSQVGSVLAVEPFSFGLVNISKDHQGACMKKAKVFAVPRIGLNAAKDKGDFCQRPYRFISFLHLPHRETEKIKRYLTEGPNKTITIEEYNHHYKANCNDQ